MIKWLYIVLLLTFIISCKAILDSSNQSGLGLEQIKEMPYIPRLSGDKLYWETVKRGKEIIPHLIAIIDDTMSTEAYVPNFGGNYTVGDVSFTILKEIVHDIHWEEFIDGYDPDKGYGNYWQYVRGGLENRKVLKSKLQEWYGVKENSIVWVKDTTNHRAIPNWYYKDKKHPAGGYFVVK